MEPPEKTTSADLTAALARGVVGALPVLGPIVAEVVTALIANQRLDRLEAYLRALDARIDSASLKARLEDPRFLDLFEDSMRLATRALPQDRIEAVAALFSNGLRKEDLDYAECKRILDILEELTDQELLILKGRTVDHGSEREEFWAKHEAAIQKPVAHMQSSQEEIDKATIFASLELHLVQLGLLRPRFKKPRRGELPEFDEKTGQMKASGHDVTPLGRLLLRSIDAQEHGES